MKKRTIGYSIILVIISALIAGSILLYSITSKKSGLKESMVMTSENASFSVEKVFSSVFNDLLYLAQREELALTKDLSLIEERTRQLKDFKAFVQNKNIYDQVRYIDKTGQEILRVNYNKGDVTIVDAGKLQSKAGSYYVDDALQLEGGQIYISRFDLNKEKGQVEQPIKPMIRFVTPYMNRYNQLDGLIVFNYLGENLLKDLSEADASSSSEVMLVNKDGYYLYNKEADKNWAFMMDKEDGFYKDFPEAWDQVLSGNTEIFSTKLGLFKAIKVDPDLYAESYVNAKMHINDTNDFYVVVRISDTVISKLHTKGLILGLVLFLIISIVSIAMVLSYVYYKEREKAHNRSVEDNLAFNKKIVDKTQSSSNVIANVSSEIYGATENANSGLEQIIHQLNSVTSSINANADTIVESNDQIQKLADKSSIVEELSRDAVEKNKEIVQHANEGYESISDVTSMITEISQSTDSVFEEISELVAKSNEINQIITLITGITEQTNLLALNAAIEAARAGEHGKGFAVVAEEVRKLADESGKSATQIASLIVEVQEKAKTSDAFIAESKNIVENSVKKTNDANAKFAAISSEITVLSGMIEEITTNSTEQNVLTQDMTKAMSRILENTESNTNAVNDINQVIQNQAAAFEEIGASIEEMSSMSDELQSISNMTK